MEYSSASPSTGGRRPVGVVTVGVATSVSAPAAGRTPSRAKAPAATPSEPQHVVENAPDDPSCHASCGSRREVLAIIREGAHPPTAWSLALRIQKDWSLTGAAGQSRSSFSFTVDDVLDLVLDVLDGLLDLPDAWSVLPSRLSLSLSVRSPAASFARPLMSSVFGICALRPSCWCRRLGHGLPTGGRTSDRRRRPATSRRLTS